MAQGHGRINIPSVVIERNPPLVASDTPFPEIVAKILEEDDSLVVADNLVPLGIISVRDIVAVIASGISCDSLTAEDICQGFPSGQESAAGDFFTIASNIHCRHYPAWGLVDGEGKLRGLINGRSAIEYVETGNLYENVAIKELIYPSLPRLSPDIPVIEVMKIISADNLRGIVIPGQTGPRIVTEEDLVSAWRLPEWKFRTVAKVASNSLPRFSPTETLPTICRALRDEPLVAINPDSPVGENQTRGDLNFALVAPEDISAVFTHGWQQQYLLKQQQQLRQLQAAVKLEKKQVEQEQLFSQLSCRIRQSLDLERILTSTVNEVRQFLNCDRVIVYQQYPDGDGAIVAEAAGEGVVTVLGKILRDRCFAKDYIQPYLQGRIQVTDDLSAANLAPCHLELLRSLQVRANLVVPIIFHNQLWGLLAAQQCNSPRNWQEDEVEFLQKLAAQVAIAIQQGDCARKALQIANYQRAIASLGNRALVTDSIDELVQSSVEIIAATLKVEYCDLWELLPNGAAFELRACIGWPPEWIGMTKMASSPRWLPGYVTSVMRPVIAEDLPVETRFSPPPFLHNRGIISGAAVNIGGRDGCYGVLGVYSQKPRKFSPPEINLLQTVADLLATAIARHKSKQQLDYFFHLSLDMFCITGIDGSFKQVNSSFLTTLGYGEGELLAHNLLDFVHPDDRSPTIQELEKLSSGLPSINFENRWRCQDGTYRWLAWKSLPSEGGTIHAVARDITLAKQAEAQLKHLNEELEIRVKNRTEELEQTSTQLRTFVQTAGTVLIVLDRQYRILEWNEEAERLFGWQRDSVLGEDYLLLFVAPAERKTLKAALDETLAHGRVQRNLESKAIISDGSDRTLLWNVNRFTDSQGKGIGVIACGQDIEEVRVAQLRLKLSEERFRSIFNQAAVGIVQVSLEGKLVLVNDKFTQLVGCTREQLADLDFPQLIHPDDVSDTLTDLSALLAGNEATFEREIRLQRPSGSILWINLTMSVVWVAVEPSYFIAVVNDISDRKKVEESLQASEARLNSILASLEDVVWSISLPEMKMRYINPACQAIYGRSPEEIAADPSIIRKLARGKEKERVERKWERMSDSYSQRLLAAEDKSWELEYQIELPRGETRWIRDRAHLVYDRYGRAISIDGISSDVTQSHRAEEKLFKSLQEKEVLLKEIHHRVKNNLYLISGLLNLQSSYVGEERVRNLFRESQNRIQTMAVIHEQLYQSDDLSEINFADYLERLVSNLFTSYSHQQKGIKAITRLEECFLNIETAIPAGLLINELVTNAFKHAFPEGQGEVTISLELQPEQQIKLTVRDDGQGFPPDLDWENSHSLGLRLVRLLSQQLDGTIQCESSPRGTIFSLQFAARTT